MSAGVEFSGIFFNLLKESKLLKNKNKNIVHKVIQRGEFFLCLIFRGLGFVKL